MIRRFFTWLALKRMSQTRYKIDYRKYRGVLRPGFHAHLNSSKFWSTGKDPYIREQRRKNIIRVVLILLGFALFVWLVIESIQALGQF